jgi:KAP family P-loop domain
MNAIERLPTMTKNVTTETELLDALEYQDNKVVALIGSWGVGKSHLWDELRKRESARLLILKPNYAYVSLFGMKSADEIRSAIFSQFISIDAKDSSKGDFLKNGLAPYVDNIKAGVAKMEGLWKMAADGFGAAFEVLKIQGISNTLICFDDFERAGEALDASQLLGIINDVTGRHKCKVLLILNDSKLSKKNKEVLGEYRERIIDKEIRYEPDYQHVLGIAIPEEKLRALVEPHVKLLGTTNIRIIRRMRATIYEISKKIGRELDSTSPGAISSVCLMTYCHLMQGTEGVPSVDEVSKVELVSRSADDAQDENKASAFLSGQNWVGVDRCDRLIGDLVSHGVVNWDALKEEIEAHRTEVAKNAKVQENREMWHEWHQRFLDRSRSEEFVRRIVETTTKNIDVVGAREVDDIVDLLKQLGEPERGKSILEVWKVHNKGNPSAHIVREIEIFGKLKDAEFQEYLCKQASVPTNPKKRIAEILASMHTNRSWGGDDYRLLVSATPEEYAQSLREYEEANLSLLGWLDLVNSEPRSEDSRSILESGKAALQLLAAESPANAIFVKSALRRVRSEPPVN